jgi:GxxExxY protein
MPYEGEDPPIWQPDDEMNALTGAVIGACMEVHRRLGPGLEEALYGNALRLEFGLRNIPFEREVTINVEYKGAIIGTRRLDFLIGGRLILEIKAVEVLTPLHKAQANTYLKITGHQLALLINFNTAILKDGIKRIIRAPD